MTAKQLIEGALRTIGVLASGEEGSPAELQDALSALNGLIGSWNNDSLIIPSLTKKEFLLANKMNYTYGIGGDFNDTRPISIEYAQFRDEAGTYFPCALYEVKQYSDLLSNTVVRPSGLYYEQSYPLAQVKFPTIPYPTDTLVLNVLLPLSKIDNITDEFNLPDGYERALKLNLAVELNAEYNGDLKQETALLALEAKKQIKIKNARIDTLSFDFATNVRYYNIYSGSSR